MYFVLLRNEFVKSIRQPLFWGLLFSLSIPALVAFLFTYTMSYEEFEQRMSITSNDLDPYHYVFKWFRTIFNFLLIPYYSIFLVWFFEIERRSQGWKFLRSLPVKITDVLYSKLLMATLFTASAMFLSALALFLAIYFLKLSKPDWPFANYPTPSLAALIEITGSIYAASLPAFLILFIGVIAFNKPAAVITAAVIAGFIGVRLNPFQFHHVASRLFLSQQSSLNGFHIEIEPALFLAALILAFGFFNKRLYSSLK